MKDVSYKQKMILVNDSERKTFYLSINRSENEKEEDLLFPTILINKNKTRKRGGTRKRIIAILVSKKCEKM